MLLAAGPRHGSSGPLVHESQAHDASPVDNLDTSETGRPSASSSHVGHLVKGEVVAHVVGAGQADKAPLLPPQHVDAVPARQNHES